LNPRAPSPFLNEFGSAPLLDWIYNDRAGWVDVIYTCVALGIGVGLVVAVIGWCRRSLVGR